MHILITGGAGFIGSHLVDKLITQGHSVTIIDKLEEPTHNGPPDYLNTKANFVLGDIGNRNLLNEVLPKTDMIFHLAATGGFTNKLSGYFNSNSLSTSILLETIRLKKPNLKKLIVASSIAVYGEGKYIDSGDNVFYAELRDRKNLSQSKWGVYDKFDNSCKWLPTDEKTPINPTTYYGITKYDQEKMCLLFGEQNNIPVTAFRFFVTYGARQSLRNPYTGVCSIFSTQILNNTSPLIYEDGEQLRDFVHVSDVVQALSLAIGNPKTNNKVFNVGTGKGTSIKELARLLIECYKKPIGLNISKKYRLGDSRNMVADITALKKIGYRPSVSLNDGIIDFADWISSKTHIKNYFSNAFNKMILDGLINNPKHEKH